MRPVQKNYSIHFSQKDLNHMMMDEIARSAGCKQSVTTSPFWRISPRRVWHAVRDAVGGKPAKILRVVPKCISENLAGESLPIIFVSFPHTPDEPLRKDYKRFPWVDDPVGLRAWQKGRTGFPIVDAGMQQLWATGWMHNRVRMIVASFLVKDLRISWLEGARWFGYACRR